MKKFLKLLLISSIVGLAGFALASCGKKADITFWHTFSKSNQVALNSLLKQFTKDTGITVDAEQKGGYDQLRDANSAAIASDTTPNLSVCYPDHVAKFNSGRNKPVVDLKKINGFYTDDELKQFYPVFVQEGQEYTRPGMFSFAFAKSTEVMYYNKTFFDENNITVPETWDNVKDTVSQIKSVLEAKKQKYSAVVGYDSSANLFISSAAETNGAYTKIVDEDGKKVGKILWADKKLNAPDVKFIREFNNLYQDKGLITKQEAPDNAYTSTLFTKQQTFMSISSTGGAKYNEPSTQTKGKTKFEVGVARVPYLGKEGKYVLQGPSLCVFNHGDEKNEKAVKLLKYLTSADFQASWATKTGYAPIRKDSLETKVYKDYMAKELTNPADVLVRDTIKLFGEIANDNQFINTATFKKSSDARTQADTIFHNVFTSKQVIALYNQYKDDLSNAEYNTKMDELIQGVLLDAYTKAQ